MFEPATHPTNALVTLRGFMAAPGGAASVLAFGDARIDSHLPGGGLPIGQLHEIGAEGIEAETGVVAGGFAAILAGAVAAQHQAGAGGVVLWIAPCCDLYAPGLLAYGIDPRRLILVRTAGDNETLSAMETALRSGAADTVLGEVGRLSCLAVRRLQLACLAHSSTGLLLRRWPHGRSHTAGGSKPAPAEGNAAVTRWRLATAPGPPIKTKVPGLLAAAPNWRVELLHARGGRPGAWIMQPRLPAHSSLPAHSNLPASLPAHSSLAASDKAHLHDGTHPLRVVAVLGDDAAVSRPGEWRATG